MCKLFVLTKVSLASCFCVTGLEFYGVVTKSGVDVQVGQVHGVADLKIAVITIHGGDEPSVTGYLVDGASCVHQKIVISAPAEELFKSGATTLARGDKRHLQQRAEEAFDYTATLLQSGDKTALFTHRRYQLAVVINREITAAAHSKAMRRRFSIGVASLELDLDILQLHPFRARKQVYSYKNGNMSSMDGLLGVTWDVRPGQGQVVFVTQLALGLTTSNMLSGSVAVAFYRGDLALDKPYRPILLDHIHAAEIPLEQEDLEVAPEDLEVASS